MLIRLGYILDDAEADAAKYYLTVRNGKGLFDYIGIRVLDTDRLELKDLSIEDALGLGLIEEEDDNRKVNIFGTHKPERDTTPVGLLFNDGETIKCRREYSPLFRLLLGESSNIEFLVDANNADFAVFVDVELYNCTKYNIDTSEKYARVFADVSDKLSISTFSGWLTDIRYYNNKKAYMFVLPNSTVCLIDLTSECNPIILPSGCTELCIIKDSFLRNLYINNDIERLSNDELLKIVVPSSITKFSVTGVSFFRKNNWFNLRLIISKQSAYELVKNISEFLSSKSKDNHKLKNQSKLEDYIKYLYDDFNIMIEFY